MTRRLGLSDGVLVELAASRARLEGEGIHPPYVVHLPPRRANRLCLELAHAGVPFGIPLSGHVPEHKEDDNRWIYLGLILGDLHVYARAK